MNVDPTINVVVFELHRGGESATVTAQGNTRAPDCIRMAWQEVRQKHQIVEREVSKIYSEWEPSVEDIKFIESQFPNVELSFSFKRPAADKWDKAIKEARRVISQSMTRAAAEPAGEEQTDFALLPVVRNADGLSEAIVSRSIMPDLVLVLAQVGTTLHGTIGVDYVMSAALKEQGMDSKALWKEALANLARGLAVNAAMQEDQKVFILNRQGGMAASAVGLPDFPQNAAKWVGSQRITIAIPDPNTLMVYAADSRLAGRLQEQTLKSDYAGAVNLTPCVLLLDKGKLSLQARRQIP